MTQGLRYVVGGEEARYAKRIRKWRKTLCYYYPLPMHSVCEDMVVDVC